MAAGGRTTAVTGFVGMRFQGMALTGIGGIGSQAVDKMLMSDTIVSALGLHGPMVDTMPMADRTLLISASHGEGYGINSGFMGIGMMGYAFQGMGSTPVYISITMSDAMRMDESLSSVRAETRPVGDAMLMADGVTSHSTYARTASSDSMLMGDALVEHVTLPRPIADAMVFNESLAQNSILAARILADSMPMIESSAGVRLFVRIATDSMPMTDTVSKASAFLRTLTDTVLMTDNALARIVRAVLDSMLMSDVAIRTTYHIHPVPGYVEIVVEFNSIEIVIEFDYSGEQMPRIPFAGTPAIATATFYQAGNTTPQDPTAVSLKVLGPSGESTYHYGTDPIERLSQGVYQYSIDTTGSPDFVWTAEWIGTEEVEAVDVAYFPIQADPLA